MVGKTQLFCVEDFQRPVRILLASPHLVTYRRLGGLSNGKENRQTQVCGGKYSTEYQEDSLLRTLHNGQVSGQLLVQSLRSRERREDAGSRPSEDRPIRWATDTSKGEVASWVK